jgi:hypothetical protein
MWQPFNIERKVNRYEAQAGISHLGTASTGSACQMQGMRVGQMGGDEASVPLVEMYQRDKFPSACEFRR